MRLSEKFLVGGGRVLPKKPWVCSDCGHQVLIVHVSSWKWKGCCGCQKCELVEKSSPQTEENDTINRW